VFPLANPFARTPSPAAPAFALGHVFMNAGLLTDRAQLLGSCAGAFSDPSAPRALATLGDFARGHTCVSVGAGLQVRLSQAARLEVNFAVPLRVPSSVQATPGLQVGLGVDFL
jgi:hypothetical protein